MSYYKTCPECGAVLDPGEKCTCSAPALSYGDFSTATQNGPQSACKSEAQVCRSITLLPLENIYISVEQATELLSVSKPTVYNLTHTEGFPKTNIGHRTVIHLEGLREWTRKQVRNA